MVATGCFDSRGAAPREDAASQDAVDATVDTETPPLPIDCEGLARRVNERPDELPSGACRYPTAACEWRNVCVGGVEATHRCACAMGAEGRADWRCEATGDAPCRGWADATTEISSPAPVDVSTRDAADVTGGPSWEECATIERMFLETSWPPPGGVCRRLDHRCEWFRYCLRGMLVDVTCLCRVGLTPEDLVWDCTASARGTCFTAPDAQVDGGAE